MTGMKVAQALERAKQERGSLPESITVDNGSELCSRFGATLGRIALLPQRTG
jgi:hypothetical protein